MERPRWKEQSSTWGTRAMREVLSLKADSEPAMHGSDRSTNCMLDALIPDLSLFPCSLTS